VGFGNDAVFRVLLFLDQSGFQQQIDLSLQPSALVIRPVHGPSEFDERSVEFIARFFVTNCILDIPQRAAAWSSTRRAVPAATGAVARCRKALRVPVERSATPRRS
jgi:hypothetical protein